MTMRISINGETREIARGTTIAELLEQLGLQPRLVAVEQNRELIPRKQHHQALLQPGDELEIVTLVGGG